MYKTFLLGIISLFMIQFASAQDFTWKTGTDGNYTYRYVSNDPIKAKYYTLSNGLTVILSENKTSPRIQTIIATKAGSKTDPADHTGLAHYLEHMLFKGTPNYGSMDWKKEEIYLDRIDELYEEYNHSTDETQRKEIYHQIDSVSGLAAKYAIANEYDKMMAGIGAQGTNAFTSFEVTAYINDIPSNQIENWLKVEAERFRKPVFRIFHTELEAVYEEKNRSLDSDDNEVFEKLFAELFKNHHYGTQTTIGTIDHLKNPSLREIRKYFYKNYVPNNMCLVMAGDFNSAKVIEMIDQHFSYMQPKDVPPYTFEPEEEIHSPIYREVTGPDAEYVTMAFRFPGANSREALLLDFMSSVLSNGTAGLMDLDLVKKQKVLSASGGSYILKDYGILYLEGKAKEGQKLEEVKDLILGEIEKLKRGEFDENLLESVIANYKKSKISGNEQNGNRAFALLDAFVSEMDWARLSSQLNMMNSITKKDITDFAEKWLGNNFVCIYKRNGKKDQIVKVEKPPITPVEVNRDAQSSFVKSVLEADVQNIKPQFIDFEKDIEYGSVRSGKTDMKVLRVPNRDNELFSQAYYFDIGKHHNKLLPMAMDYLNFLGTENKTSEEISKAFYSLACDFNVHVGDEDSYITLNGLQENYSKALTLMEDLIWNCQPNEDALREMISNEKKQRADGKLNKGLLRRGLMYWSRFGKDNPFNYVLGNAELETVTSDELIRTLQGLFSYVHQTLYYGPMPMNNLQQELKKHRLPEDGFRPSPEKHHFIYQDYTKPQVLFTEFDMVQSELTWSRNNENFDLKDFPYINMFNEYFGGNMSGIVFQDIRESRALAYSAYAYYNSPNEMNKRNSMMAYVGCQADKMKESIDAMGNLLNNLPKSDKLFATSKASLLNSIQTERITKMGIIYSYIRAGKMGTKKDYRQDMYHTIQGLQLTDIENFHRMHISGKPYTLNVVGSKNKLDMNELKRFGGVQEISLENLFGY